MDGGITPGFSSQLSDPDYRFELYKDWKSIMREEPNYPAQKFCKLKGIPFESLGALVREFDSYDPTGEKWGLNK